jgi:hypothetical protein
MVTTNIEDANYSSAKLGILCHWIGLRENLQESPIFNGKNHGFL